MGRVLRGGINMITKKQRKRLHALEKAEKKGIRFCQRLLHLEGEKLAKHFPRWRKCNETYGYRGKAYYLWEDFGEL